MRLLVDGTNVMGSRPDGWWRDRSGAARRLVTQLADLSRRQGDQIVVVFDGRPFSLGEHGLEQPAAEQPVADQPVTVEWARRGGPDAADDRLVELLAADPAAASVTVVTSDRRLQERAQVLGATVAGAGWLLRRLDPQARISGCPPAESAG